MPSTIQILRTAIERGDAVQAAYDSRIRELLTYYGSSKFAGPDADYAHVTTDLLPRLRALLMVPAEVETQVMETEQ